MALGYRDFDDFGRWYAARRVRSTGRPASQHTCKNKQAHLARLANMGSPPERGYLGDVCSSRSEWEFLMDRLHARMTPGSVRPAVYALIDYQDFLCAQGELGKTEGVVNTSDVPAKNPVPAISVYSQQEMENFVTAARGVDARWWAFMAYLVDTGRRVGETLSLRWPYFRLEGDPPYVELPDTKTGNPQYVPLTGRLATEVFTPENILRMKQTPLRKGSAYPHVGDPDNQPFPWSYNVARARFVRFCERGGMPYKGFHCFRHTVITDRLARGVPIQAVAALAGHKHVSTTDVRYNHTNALSYAAFVERSG